MNSNCSPRIPVMLGAVAGGLVAAALLPMAVANADEYLYLPDPINTGFDTLIWGSPSFGFGAVSEAGANWDTTIFTHIPNIVEDGTLTGNDTHTAILSFSSDTFLVTANDAPSTGVLAPGSTIDLFQYGLGFGNELVVAAAGANANEIPAGIYDTAITPFGDFLLF